MSIAVGGSGLRRLRSWALWSCPGSVIGCFTVVVTLAAAVAVVEARRTELRATELTTWLVMSACAAVCVEAIRRVREPAGTAKDLLSAWTLPVALLLPPVYGLIVVAPLTALTQVRVRRGLVHRRVYSAAAIGLSNWVVSVVFHRYLSLSSATTVPVAIAPAAIDRALMVGAALLCGALGSAVNVLLIGLVAWLSSPETRWREALGDGQQRVLDLGEVCLGVTVAGAWVTSPALALVMLVPVLLVQRTLSIAQLQAAARTDAKTGLLNAGAWQEEAEREIVRARREGSSLAVLLADLDHFKRVNDVHGHLVGDQALVAAARALGDGLRSYDLLGRFGGEEFTALLPHTDADEALRVAERLRRIVAAAPVLVGDTTVEITVSVGVAVLGAHGEDLTDLLTAADAALYRAKGEGRNRVASAGADPSFGPSCHEGRLTVDVLDPDETEERP